MGNVHANFGVVSSSTPFHFQVESQMDNLTDEIISKNSRPVAANADD